MHDSRELTRIHYGGIEQRQEMSLQAVLDEWQTTQSTLETTLAALSDTAWRERAPYETTELTDFGGLLEAILVIPPRPMYRHLPVHIPDSAAGCNRIWGQKRE